MKDRRDGFLVKESDPMHLMMPYLMPNRADNEALLDETIDLGAINRYLEEKNASSPEFKYTFFHIICAALVRTIAERPKMNRFYIGYRLYDRKEISLSFVVKKMFADDAPETLAIVKYDPKKDESPVEQIYSQVKKIVFSVRKENATDGATDAMAILTKLPRPILRLVMKTLDWLNYHDWYPKGFMECDPYFSTAFLSNLGSIRMNADYHHLANWGTNSVFVIIGEKKATPFFEPDGTYTMREALNIGFTIDERIADGYYFAKSIKLFKALLDHPELLDKPATEALELTL